MSGIRHDLSDAALAAAVEANLLGEYALMRQWPGAEVHDDPEMLWTITNVPFADFNAVLRARLAPDRVGDAIEEAIARGRARNVPASWWTGPATRPADLGAHLVKHGFVAWAEPPGMAMDLASLTHADTPAGVRVERVRDRAMLRIWAHVMVAGSSLPAFVEEAYFDWYSSLGLGAESLALHYLAWLGSEPVATSSLMLAEGAAGIYNVATLPEARGRGIGSATTYTALREAQRRGYRVAVVQASEMGCRMYRRLGFREYCTIGIYGWTPGKGQA